MPADGPDQATIELDAERPMQLTVQVTDIQGRVISTLDTHVIEGKNRFIVPVGNSHGIHVVTLQGENTRAVIRYLRP